MKKITTLLVAIALTAGAYALPQRMVNKLNVEPAQTKVERPSAQYQTKQKALADFALRKGAPARLTHPQFKSAVYAPAAEVLNISFNELVPDMRYTPAYYANYGFWYLIFDDGTDEGSFITLAIYSDGDDLSGTYTEEDCFPNYTGANLFVGADTINGIFNSVNISFTPTSEGVQITGAFVLDSTINITLSYFEEKLMPKDTVDLVISNAKIDEQSISWQVEGATADHAYIASVLAFGEKVVGSYTAEDLNMWGTFVAKTVAGDTTIIDFLGDYAGVEAEVEDNNYVINLSMIGVDTVLYNVEFTAPLPVAKDTITVAAGNLSIDASLVEFMGVVFIAASNSEYTLSIMLDETQAPNGTYTTDDFLSSFLAKGEQSVGFVQGSININAAENTVKGELLGDDMIRYILDLKFELPTPKDTVKVAFTEVKALKYDKQSEDYYVYYANDKYGVQVDFYGEAESPVGIYKMLDDEAVDGYYTFVEQYADGDTIGVATLDAKIEVEATAVDTIYAVEAYLLCEDSIAYVFTFNCHYTYQEPTAGALDYDTEDADLHKVFTTEDVAAFYAEDYEAYDVIYFEAVGVDDLRYLSLEFNVGDVVIKGDTMPAAGTYTIDLSGIANTVTASEGVIDGAVTGSFSGVLTSDLTGVSTVGLYFFVSGTVTVSYDAEKNVKIVVAAKNSYGRNITMEYSNMLSTPVENIDVDTTIVRKTIENGQLVILRDEKKFNVLGAQVQ